MRNDPRGSIWRKWDLHVHSPASFHWNGKHFSGEPATDEELLGEMVKALNSADAAAFCIMDYWTFDGWFALRSYVTRHEASLSKSVFPGIELRLEAPTNFRLNTHFLFDETLSDQQLREFLSALKIGVISRTPSREAFIELGKTYDNGKLAKHGFKPEDRGDDDQMARLGMMTAKITRDSWRVACESLVERVLIVQPYDTSDGLEQLDWKRHPYDDAELMRAADFFETRNLQQVRLFLGAARLDKPQLSEDFKKTLGGRWKPVVSGSDAHRLVDYAVFPEGKTSWIKADTTFAGLRQCMVDPIGRVYIGAEPPKVRHCLDNSTKYISRLRIHRVAGDTYPEKWFDCDLALNPGMIAIIGNRGCGKSALADVIALAGNSHCASFEFLNSRRFKKPGDNKAAHYEAILTWGNGEEVPVSLAYEPRHDQPERVRYLPQQYLEQLCSEVGSEGRTVFEGELRKVIFSHVPTARRLGLSTLDELVKYRTEQAEEHAAGLRHQLSVLNNEISGMEHALLPDSITALQSQILLKEKELEAHEARRPLEVVAPTERGQGVDADLVRTIDDLRQAIEEKRAAIEEVEDRKLKLEVAAAAANRLVQRLRNLEAEVRRAIDAAGDDARLAGVSLAELVEFRINVASTAEHHERLEREARDVTQEAHDLDREHTDLLDRLAQAQEEASEPERVYQEHLAAMQDWEAQRVQIVGASDALGTMEYFKARLQDLESSIPAKLEDRKRERLELSRQLYDIVRKQLDIYRELYAPIESAASQHQFVRDYLRLEFNVLIEGIGFAERLLSYLNQGRRGTFYGQVEGVEAARRLVQRADFSTWDGTNAFLESVLDALRTDQREGRGQAASLSSQLRDGLTEAELYDLVFGLTYLRPRLTLQLAGKEVGELSPGERGVLLLVFYLLLDREEIPLVIDQPEHNLDNASVYRLLEPCIRRAKNRRQIVLVTHNPNVAIVCDAEQVIAAEIDKQDGYKVSYKTGAIENPSLNLDAVNVLEGTWPAFEARDAAYQRPIFT